MCCGGVKLAAGEGTHLVCASLHKRWPAPVRTPPPHGSRVFDLRTRQDLNRGFNDALGRGIDLALTPVVFGGIGWLIDRVAGTSPIFTILVATIGVVGTVVKIKLGYDKEMAAFDDTAATRPREVQPLPVKPARTVKGAR